MLDKDKDIRHTHLRLKAWNESCRQRPAATIVRKGNSGTTNWLMTEGNQFVYVVHYLPCSIASSYLVIWGHSWGIRGLTCGDCERVFKKTTASGQTFWGNEPSWTTGSGIRTAKYKYLSLSLNQLYLKSLHWKSHIFRRNKYLLVVNFISQCQITGGLFSIWSFLSNRKTTAVFNLVLFAPVAGSNRTSMGP